MTGSTVPAPPPPRPQPSPPHLRKPEPDQSKARLPDPRPTRDKDARLVQDMFDRVAPRYDIANAILSIGSDQHWRRVAVRALDAQPDEVVLDVATGTGLLAREIQRSGARALALDFSWEMLAAGKVSARRDDGPPMAWINGDGTALPFADGSVDAVTISFGLRNLPDPRAGLAEFARVVRPGGRLLVMEFSTPTDDRFRRVYRDYLVRLLPRLADLVTSDPAAYRYLAESILAWPDQQGLAGWIAEAGWTRPRWRNLSGGIVAVHMATAPGAPGAG